MSGLSDRVSALSSKKRALLAQRLRTEAAPAIPSIQRRRDGGPVRLSFAQERLWFVDRWQPGTVAYNILEVIQLSGELDGAALVDSLNELVRRHESLRTVFVQSQGIPLQVILPAAKEPMPVVDLSSLPAPRRPDTVQDLAVAEAQTPFDLAQGPLLRARLFKTAKEEHFLILTLHHIVTDLWSSVVILRDVATIYQKFRAGDRSPLPELEIQFADFAVWQRNWLSGEVLAKQLAYWRQQLQGASFSLDLPSDRSRPSFQSHRGDQVPFSFPAALVVLLKGVAREAGSTLFMVLLAAFCALVQRYSGQKDFLIGSPIAGRTLPELEPLVGLFVNTLVLRADLRGNPSFLELLDRIRKTTLEAFTHQEIPFDKLVEELQPERDPARAPLVQLLFAFQSAPAQQLELPDLTLTPFDCHNRGAKLDLSCFCWESGEGGITGGIEYSTDLFEAIRIRRMTGHFQGLLESAAAEPGRPSNDLSLLTAPERHQILLEWTATSTGDPSGATIHSLFAWQVRQSPESIALIHGGQEWSYEQLDERASHLARRLRGLGVCAELPVGLYAVRSPEMVIAILAILKAGGAYVPLDPAYPGERLQFLLADANTPVLLVQESLLSTLPNVFSMMVVWVIEEELRLQSEAGELEEEAGPDSLAYVMYTSGSTGLPKGVAIPHRAVVRLVRDTGYAHFSPEEVFLQFAPISFDASTFEIWGALLNGGRLVLAPSGDLSLAEMGALLGQHGVTSLWLTAGLFHQMVDEELKSLSGLRQLLAGGDVLSPHHVSRAVSELAGTTVINGYGPTENTTFTCCYPMTDASLVGATVPVGRPIANSFIHILDSSQGLVPIGVFGELYAGGEGLARGYLNRPDLTAERFVPSPFGWGERLYRTGDVARYLEDGRVEFRGRIDRQVKVRGFRIELGEIELVLSSHPSVQAAVALLVETEEDRRLVAVVATGDAAQPSEDELRQFLESKLPKFMIPSPVAVLPALPLTANGKVDRLALTELVTGVEEVSGPEASARLTWAEELLAGIWSEVLGREHVSVQEDFFDLGGHSLLATRVIAQVRKVFGVELSLRALFEGPTISQLGLVIETELRNAQGLAVPSMIATKRRESVPLSFAQERLWFLDQLEPGSAAYNVPGALKIAGPLDIGALTGSLREIVRRHEVVRTTFGVEQGRPIQKIRVDAAVTLPVMDLRTLPADLLEGELGRLMTAEAAHPFDLAAGPLFRVHIVRIEAALHILLINLHHIVSDGWSIGILVRELAALYRAFTAGELSPLAELPVQYADYSSWQRRWLAGEVLEKQLDYWHARLSGVPYFLELPSDRPRSPTSVHRGGVHRFFLPSTLVDRVRGVARSTGSTLFMVLLAAWDTLLYRYTGQEKILVGSPVAGRALREVEALIGFFVNTLVLRADLAGDLSFLTLVGQTKETALEAFAHQDLPFERIVEELQPERDPARPPLVQVMFAFQNVPMLSFHLRDLTIEPIELESGTTKFDLTFSLMENQAGLAASFEYDVDLFDASRMHRFADHFGELLQGAVIEPDRRLSEIALLAPVERFQILLEWNDTARAFPRVACLHQLFEAQVDRFPDQVAVRFEEESLSYRELDRRSNQLAHWLLARGVGPERIVALLLDRSLEMVIALLGTLKAGGAYLPLDPSYPPDRLNFLVADSAPRVVLTLSRYADLVPVGSSRVLLDTDWPLIADGSAQRLESPSDLGQLAYVIYTSGSTGRPKATMNSHRGIVNRLLWMCQSFPFGENERVLQKTPYTFDVSVCELFAPALGARLVLARPGGHREPLYLAGLIDREEITHVHFVPSMLRVFLEEGVGGFCGSVRRVVTSGEELTPELVAKCFDTLPGADLYNLYGPTEAAVEVTAWICRRGEGDARVPIGWPIANLRIHLLEPGGEPVPLGVPGELHIGGTGVGRGYLGQPELTAERFVPDPFGGEPGTRLYRAGDLARHRPDGAIEFLGRIDHQVKIRGVRIELGEVETALAQHPGIRVAVAGVHEVDGERQLVAYLVAEAAAPAREELRDFLRKTSPEALIPSAFVFLPEMPLTSSGKADRRALARLSPVAAPASQRVAPRQPLEELLLGIWADVLRREGESFGVEDNFFDLGGHSLATVRVASRIREACGVELPLRRFFEAPTIASLAGEVEAARRQGRVPVAPPLLPVSRNQPLPLSFAQERLWFLDQLVPGAATYNMPIALGIAGALHGGALRESLRQIVLRHEVLRTTFRTQGSIPVQEIHPADSLILSLLDLSALPEEVREAEARQRTAEDAVRPFDLARGPMRASLLRLAPDRHVLLITQHHIASDGWSLGVLVRELVALYQAFATGEPTPLPELPVQYADYAVWQRQWLAGEVLEMQRAYWIDQLQGIPAMLEIPADRPRPPVQTAAGRVLRFAVPAELAESLRALGRATSATLFMALLAGWTALLHRYTGQAQILVGSPVAGRTHRALESLIGFFVNTLVLRADLSGELEYAALLAQVRGVVIEAFAHQDLPFEKLVEELQPERDPSRSPLVQVMFVLQNAPAESLEVPGLRFTPLDLDLGTARLDLSVALSETDGRIEGTIEFNTDLFETVRIQRLAGHLIRLLAEVSSQPARRLSEISLLSAAEEWQLRSEWNDTVRAVPAWNSFAELFAAQAQRWPDALAVRTESRSLSYQELDRQSTLAGQWLRAHGVGPEQVVGVLLERSIEAIVAFLGIFKAGGAYLPLDPANPLDRLSFVVADARCRLVLTRAGMPEIPGAPLVLELPKSWEEVPGAEAFRLETTPENLAYVIYTSGSTGRPKGVAISHRGLLNLVEWQGSFQAIAPGHRFSHLSNLAFDASVFETWPTLASGASLHIVSDEIRSDPQSLAQWLIAKEVSLVFAPTPLAEALLQQDWSRPGALRGLMTGGEVLRRRPAADLGFRLINHYGPTEASVAITMAEIEPVPDLLDSFFPPAIGRPIANFALHVAGPWLERAPMGVPGELLIGGAGLARGYLHRPDLTAERFVPDPWGPPGARLYRTRDLVRWSFRGDLHFLGRLDRQVKLRGLRIELGEIEAALVALAGVREAVVELSPAGEENRRLVAYLVPEPGFSLSPTEVKAALGKRLPDYMIPTAFVPLEAIPLTTHGKVDRAALPRLDRESSVPGQEYVPPVTFEERKLARIWAQALGIEQVGLHDNFFSLGGDSILSLRVRSLAAKEGLTFELQDLFRYPTVGTLAQVLRSEADEVVSSVPFALLTADELERLPAGIEDAYPLTALQSGLLFHSARESAWTPYHNVSRYVLQGRLDPAIFLQAVRQLLKRHPVLRTSFYTSQFDRPLQLVHRAVPLPVQIVDLRGLSPEARQRQVAARFDSERRRRFDWESPPLLRFWIHLLADDTFELGVAEHHAILDGWSFATLLTELFAIYFYLAEGDGEPLQPLASTFRDFVALERRTSEDEAVWAFWTERLADRVSPGLPRWPVAASAASGESRVGRVTREVPAVTVEALGHLAAAARLPFKSLLLAAHLESLAEFSGSREVLTGLAYNGRTEGADGEGVVGLFINLLPLRLRAVPGSWLELAREAFRLESEAMPYRRLPLAELQRRLSDGEPLFEVTFNYVHFHVLQRVSRLPLLEAEGVAETSFPLAVTFARGLDGGQLLLALQYDSSELQRPQVEMFAEMFLRALDSLVASPDGDGLRSSLLSAAQRHQLLVEWNDTAMAYPQDRCVHELIEARVDSAPEAVALVAEEGCLTYGELDRRATALAHRLRALGVAPDTRVGVCVERSLEMIVGILGVLKAGGVYVPLDPDYPADRLAFMIEDSGLRILLSQRRLAHLALPAGLRRLDLDGEEVRAANGESLPRLGPGAGPAQAAYIIYTSGSTGRPKGVVVPHRALVTRLLLTLRDYPLTAADRLLQKASFSFDFAVWECLVPLLAGARLVLARPGGQRDPEYLVRTLIEHEITIVHFVPSLLRAFLADPGVAECRSLRYVLSGGEALSMDLCEAFYRLGLPARLRNQYGPTEVTIDMTDAICIPGDPPYGTAPIGRPLANCTTYVLDAERRPVPAGAPGELFVGGHCVSRGYLGRPDLTAEKFWPDPFSSDPGARFYRSGDRVRLLADGRLQFLGRIDNQVKIRGFRVELGEIEAALLALPAVRQAAVVAWGKGGMSSGDGVRLVGYLVFHEGEALSDEELRTALRQDLPDYMVPAAFVMLSALPLNANGKLDRRNLPDPGRAVLPVHSTLPPRDEMELALVQIWEELLGTGPVGVRDDFFALGGHSLLALQLMGGIERRFGRRIPLPVLLEAPTVEKIGQLLRSGESLSRRSLVVPIKANGSRTPLFCVHPVGGNVLCYLPLSRQEKLEVPVYGIQSAHPEAPDSPRTIEEMAGLYLQAMREIQATGPYLLAGWSLGGFVAFEMARQLEAAGEQVALLALLDVAPPTWHFGLKTEPEVDLLDFVRDLLGVSGLGLTAVGVSPQPGVTLEGLLAREEVRAALPPGLGEVQLQELFSMFRRNRLALRAYRPGVYGGRIALIQAEDTLAAFPTEEYQAWRALASAGVDLHTLPGDHYSLLRPASVPALSALLAEHIEQALGPVSP